MSAKPAVGESSGDSPRGQASQRPGDQAGEGPGGNEEAARAICLRLLAAGPLTRAQLAGALRRKRVPDEVAAAVLDRFAEVGLIDDAAFARAWVESRHQGRGLARRALSAELRQRGVDPDQARAAVALIGADDELARARQLVARRAALSRGKPLPARVRQLVGLLARKGYPAGVAYQVVREALAEEHPGLAAEDVELAGADQDPAGEDDEAAGRRWPGEG